MAERGEVSDGGMREVDVVECRGRVAGKRPKLRSRMDVAIAREANISVLPAECKLGRLIAPSKLKRVLAIAPVALSPLGQKGGPRLREDDPGIELAGVMAIIADDSRCGGALSSPRLERSQDVHVQVKEGAAAAVMTSTAVTCAASPITPQQCVDAQQIQLAIRTAAEPIGFVTIACGNLSLERGPTKDAAPQGDRRARGQAAGTAPLLQTRGCRQGSVSVKAAFGDSGLKVQHVRARRLGRGMVVAPTSASFGSSS